jgi:hypothetical protein
MKPDRDRVLVQNFEARAPFRAAAQLRKARKLADTLMLVGVENADNVRELNEAGRRLAERVANVTVSSETTWAMVAVLFE